MNIIVDAFGGDNAPLEIIKGCVEAVAEYNINVTLTGDETKIKNVFSENSLSMNNIVHRKSQWKILLSLFLKKKRTALWL